jgi:hypothetical protein
VVTESWKGDTDGILVFVSHPPGYLVRVHHLIHVSKTGLFSATVATFIIESLQSLSPDSGDTTNALLTQITQQLVNISHGAPLTSIAAQSGQSFKPTASAVRVNVLWFFSLILSLNCALSATLMQQWARRYQELAQRPGAFHRRGRMRAYIFDGINRFGMTRAVATMPTLLHLSVFLFFAGLVDFLFPIYPIVAYAALGCIMAFALPYAVLTVLPNFYLNCPYGTPLSSMTWRISQFSAIIFLQTLLGIGKSFSKIWTLANRQAPESGRLKGWREMLENQVKIRRQWFSQGIRRSVELSAYRADSTMVTGALVWTLTALDEDKEIEDFAARVPGFCNSRVDQDATLAILPLMYHEPNTYPIFGSRLYDLLKSCISGTSVLDEVMRKKRLRVCLNCLWYFGRAYNQAGVSEPLPSYFPNTLIPEITRVQAEADSGVRVIGRCFGALIVSKILADTNERTEPISNAELACLSTILNTQSRDVELLLDQPGAVALANMISFMIDDVCTFFTDTIPSDVLDIVQQTLGILSQPLLVQERSELQLDHRTTIINGSDGKFEHTLLSSLHNLFITCFQPSSPLVEATSTLYLRTYLKGLWYFGRASHRLENSVPLPSHIHIAFSDPIVNRYIREHPDLNVRVIGHCVRVLITIRLAVNINSHTDHISDAELTCLSTISTIFDIESHNVRFFVRQPGAVALANMILFVFDEIDKLGATKIPPDVLDVVQKTFQTISLALPVQETANVHPAEPITTIDGSDAGNIESILLSSFYDLLNTSIEMASPLTGELEERTRCLRMCLKGLWRLGRMLNQLENSALTQSIIRIAFSNQEVTRRIREHPYLAVRVIGQCIGVLVVNELGADINSRADPITDMELACLAANLGPENCDVTLFLTQPATVALANMIALTLGDHGGTIVTKEIPSDVLVMVQQTFSVLSDALSAREKNKLQLAQPIPIIDGSDGQFERFLLSRLLHLHELCLQYPPLFDGDVHDSCLRICTKGLWYFARAFNRFGNAVPLPHPFTNPQMVYTPFNPSDPAPGQIAHCVAALVVNKLGADINSGNIPISDVELTYLSAILDTKRDGVIILLSHPGAIQFANLVFLVLDDIYDTPFWNQTLDVLDVLSQTFSILLESLPAQLDEEPEMRLDLTDTLKDVSKGQFELIPRSRLYSLNMHIRDFISSPCLAQQSFSHVLEELVESHKNPHRTWGLDSIAILHLDRLHPPRDHSSHPQGR